MLAYVRFVHRAFGLFYLKQCCWLLIKKMNPALCGFLLTTKSAHRAHEFVCINVHYAIAATFLVKREILRAARFFGITLPADFIILLSALRAAATAAALSPDSTATNTFFAAVLTALRRDVLIAFFLADTKILFSDDL